MSSPEVTLLKRFVALCKADPDMLHKPEMAFYKEYLQSLGATIPSKTQKTSEQSQFTSNQFEEQQEPESEISEDVLPKPDLDESGILVDKSGNDLLPMGDQSKETTEEDMEQSNVNRDLAHTYFSQAEYEKSLEHYTKAIMLNPGSSMLFAKRANSLIKLSKFAEAIRDCDRAIKINPDSAQAYKFRGRAHRLLGHWIEAHSDLAIACKLDYDETANEWLKEVEPNAKKLHEYIRTKERLTEEKELQARRERVRKAQEANKHAAEDATASGQNAHDEGGEGFGMGPFADLFKDDPELLNALKKDPSLLMKVLECVQNPANMMKHMDNPVIQKLMTKLTSKMGGAGGFPHADYSDMPSTEFDGDNTPHQMPKKAPEPDLD